MSLFFVSHDPVHFGSLPSNFGRESSRVGPALILQHFVTRSHTMEEGNASAEKHVSPRQHTCVEEHTSAEEHVSVKKHDPVLYHSSCGILIDSCSPVLENRLVFTALLSCCAILSLAHRRWQRSKPLFLTFIQYLCLAPSHTMKGYLGCRTCLSLPCLKYAA